MEDDSSIVCFEEVVGPKKDATREGLNTLPVKIVAGKKEKKRKKSSHSGGGVYVLGSYIALK